MPATASLAHLHRFPAPALSPQQAITQLVQRHRPFWLDGAVDADGLGRMSYLGCDPPRQLRVDSLSPPPRAGLRQRREIPVLLDLEAQLRALHPLIAVGALTYDLGRAVERLPPRQRPDDLGVAPIDLGAYDAVFAYDAALGRADILATDGAAAARLTAALTAAVPPVPPLRPGDIGAARFCTEGPAYMAQVERVLEYLRAGDCYQVNLCRRLCARLADHAALPLYLRLRRHAPAPLGAFLRLDAPGATGAGPVLLSNSPELLADADFTSGQVETRPIKGTRPRGADDLVDQRLLAALRGSEKDLAEHLMIVDLLRNDLGRIAEVGSVAVEGFARPLSLPTVHHLVSTVRARARRDIGWGELLAALLPGGSITGAPKVRAMEIIDELEDVRRGPCYGAVGWLTPQGGRLALCIRTAVVRGGELVLSVGGGVVMDSTPADELAETEVKAAAFLRALATATIPSGSAGGGA